MNIITKGLRREREATPQERTRAARRKFFRQTSLGLTGLGLGLAVSGCDDDEEMTGGGGGDAGVDLGSGDIGVLNYAYALEQLEAAFYAEVLGGTYFAGANADERAVLTALEAHERAHKSFFAGVIPSASRIPDLEVDFSSVDFASRDSVLAAAQAFEDLGVSAYNGAGRLLTNPDYLTLAGKIVSVEARHASVIRDLIGASATAFAGDDVIDANGLDAARTPTEVLAAADTFVTTVIDASNLPS